MRDEGRFLGGDAIQRPPAMFVGAAANPFADPFEIRVPRLAKKVAAGAEFIQTQCIYNLEKFESWMGMVRDRGLHEKVFILAGVTPLKSAGMARYMKTKVPGMDVPDEVVKRMAGVPKEKQAEEGITICIETIQRLKEVQGVAASTSWPSSGRSGCRRSSNAPACFHGLRPWTFEMSATKQPNTQTPEYPNTQTPSFPGGAYG